MINKLKQSSTYYQIKNQVKLAGTRLADHHVNLAVTGLSRSGKTAFITSLINQLMGATTSANLPFFSVVSEQRLVGVKRDIQPDVTVARFAYEQGVENLSQTPPQWPQSTNGVSQVRLLIKYRNQSGFRRVLSEYSTLTLDITDYPGEWLLDLPLLELSYEDWCIAFWESMHDPLKDNLAKEFKQQVMALDANQTADEMQIQRISQCFTDYLQSAKKAGYQLIQPGRFVLPGELAGAPVLQFFPMLPSQINTHSNEPDSLYFLLNSRFEDYQKKVIKPFYSDHFKRFDRQLILVDCLSALNQGEHSFNDLRKAINWLLGSFHYGSSNILKRLFAPKIDKLIFAASKADQVTADQQSNLVKLLESMVHESRQQIQFEGVATESTAFAAIRTSKAGKSMHNGESLNVLQGRTNESEKVTLYPGDVPEICPNAAFWRSQGFNFPEFLPMPIEPGTSVFPHIRLDHILEFILADKLQ